MRSPLPVRTVKRRDTDLFVGERSALWRVLYSAEFNKLVSRYLGVLETSFNVPIGFRWPQITEVDVFVTFPVLV